VNVVYLALFLLESIFLLLSLSLPTLLVGRKVREEKDR
jgi:hypothetical protein